MKSQRFKDTRTGKIVTQVPISEIAHFEKYSGNLQAGDICITAIDGSTGMDTATAFQIVYELAEQNIADQLDMPAEHERQFEALDVAHDFIVNNICD